MMRNHIGTGILAAVSCAMLGVTGTASAQTYGETVLADNPVLYWNFDEAVDNAPAADSSANPANTLIVLGNTTRTAGTTTAGGAALGRAASFDGTDGTRFAVANLSPTADLASWGMEFWFQNLDTANNPSRDYLFESDLEAVGFQGNRPAILYNYNGVSPDSPDRFELFTTHGGGSRTGATNAIVADTNWHHVAIVYYGSTLGDGTGTDRHDFYIDGVLAGTGSLTGVGALGMGELIVGNSNGAGLDPFQGNLDELAIYDFTGMSDGDITARAGEIAGHFSAVPEPSALGAGLAAASVLVARRRRRRHV